MSAIVLDCSVAVAWCFADEAGPETNRSLDLVQNVGAVVPSHWIVEVSNTLLAGERRQRVAADRVEEFRQLLFSMPIVVDSSTWTTALTTTLQLARQYHLTAYDAAYLELALRTGGPLASKDRALIRAAGAAGVSVIDLG